MKKLKWIQGDLHTHTDFSDGLHSVEEAVNIAKGVGLDFIVLSDHNTFMQNEYIFQNNQLNEASNAYEIVEPKDFVLVYGVELTTPKGHCNVIGIKEPFEVCDFSQLKNVKKAFESSWDKGAFLSINHPMIGDKWQWGFENFAFHAVEIWNGSPIERNQEIINWWQEQLCIGKKIIGTGGSDVHQHGTSNRYYGQGNVWVLVDTMTQENILLGLMQGHVCVASHPKASKAFFTLDDCVIGDTYEVKLYEDQNSFDFIDLEISFSMEEQGVLKIIGDQGIVDEIVIPKSMTNITYQVSTRSKFYRLELWHINDNNVLYRPFYTNPIYIR